MLVAVVAVAVALQLAASPEAPAPGQSVRAGTLASVARPTIEREGILTGSPPRGKASGMMPTRGRVDLPALASGAQGRWVARLQRELALHQLYRGELDGDYGPETAYAVMAFHKVMGREPDTAWHLEDWGLLASWAVEGILERHPNEPDRVEVDIGRQVLFIIRDSKIAVILPVSTANGERYFSEGAGGKYVYAYTPRGDFHINRHIAGWRINYLGALYHPWYFTEAYAIHGSDSVPGYPASHGCVRIPNWEAERLGRWVYIGMPVHTWDT